MVTGIQKEMFYLTMHSTHFIYSYMALDTGIQIETILVRPLPMKVQLLFVLGRACDMISNLPRGILSQIYRTLIIKILIIDENYICLR